MHWSKLKETTSEYNFDTKCIYNKVQAIQETTLTNCTVPWAKNNTNICSDPNDARRALSMAEYITSVGTRDCPNWCQSMPMKFSGGPTKGGFSSSLTFHFQPLIPTSTEKYLYTFLNFFAEVGGYTGIIFGYSLLTFADSLYEKVKSN